MPLLRSSGKLRCGQLGLQHACVRLVLEGSRSCVHHRCCRPAGMLSCCPRLALVLPFAGLLTGRATGFLYRTRAKLFKFAEETEMTKVLVVGQHREETVGVAPDVLLLSRALPSSAHRSPPPRPPPPLLPFPTSAARGDAGHHVPAKRDSQRAAGRHQPLSARVSRALWCACQALHLPGESMLQPGLRAAALGLPHRWHPWLPPNVHSGRSHKGC